MADLKEIQIGSTVYNLKDETARNSVSALQAAVGSPLVANTASDLSDTTKIYVYTGSETGYTAGHWYYYNGSAWTDGGTYNSQGIGAGTVNGQKLSDDIKNAILNAVAHMAFIDANGQTYYNNLVRAFTSDAVLLSISAVFDQGQNIVYDVDSIDDLKQYLTVTAYYDDNTSSIVTDYILSGTLEEGTSTISVSYIGKTDTFDVVVSPKIIKEISGDDLTYTGLKFSKPYYEASTTRLSYTPFDILIESGKKYQIKAYTDVPTADMSVHIYNTTAVSAANSNQTFTNANADVAWRNTLDFTYDASATINGKAPRAIRVSFKYDSSDSTVSSKFINRVTVREVK